MKKVANIFTAPAKHWVGNGFHVASMFSYNDKDKNLDPFLLMDYNEPKFFQGGRRDDSEFALRGVGEHPHRGFETVTIAYQGEVSPDSASVLACTITIYCSFGVSKITRQAHE